MVAQVASLGSFSLMQGQMARAVAPAAAAPVAGRRPQQGAAQQDRAQQDLAQQDAPQHVVSAVAFAPAAMSVLIEAQEQQSDAAPVLDRDHTVEKIDRLIDRLGGAPPASDPSFAVRRLQAARAALAQGPIDLHA
jgi:hypothetical protein